MKTIVKVCAISLLPLCLLGCSKEKKHTADEPVRVKTVCAEVSADSSGNSYSATVEASTSTSLSFAAPGTIRSMLITEGDRVAKGQLIATLDPTSLQNAYDIAAAATAQAQDAYNRMKQLHDANSLPDMQWVEVQNTLRQAQSAEAIARKNLNDTKLYAPAAGYVSEKLADAGMNVAPGIPVATIVSINNVKVNASVPENRISSIPKGATATIRVSALGDKSFTGRLAEKGVAANPLSRSYDVKFEVANPQGELLPGMVCELTIDANDTAESRVMQLPINAVLIDADNQNFVWLNNKGVAEKRIVEVGKLTDRGIVITSGLAPGDSVIVEGQQKVSRGTKVVTVK